MLQLVWSFLVCYWVLIFLCFQSFSSSWSNSCSSQSVLSSDFHDLMWELWDCISLFGFPESTLLWFPLNCTIDDADFVQTKPVGRHFNILRKCCVSEQNYAIYFSESPLANYCGCLVLLDLKQAAGFQLVFVPLKYVDYSQICLTSFLAICFFRISLSEENCVAKILSYFRLGSVATSGYGSQDGSKSCSCVCPWSYSFRGTGMWPASRTSDW